VRCAAAQPKAAGVADFPTVADQGARDSFPAEKSSKITCECKKHLHIGNLCCAGTLASHCIWLLTPRVKFLARIVHGC
jgi:hypothetical protein